MTMTETTQATAGKVSERAQTEKERHDGGNRDLLALETPVVSLHIHRPNLHLPRMTTAPAERAARAARSALPSPSRLAYYGGLGAMAAFGAIEWPVAVAIGVGTAIGQRVRREGKRAPRAGGPVTEPVTEPVTGSWRDAAVEPRAKPGTGGKNQLKAQAGTGTKTERMGEGKSRT